MLLLFGWSNSYPATSNIETIEHIFTCLSSTFCTATPMFSDNINLRGIMSEGVCAPVGGVCKPFQPLHMEGVVANPASPSCLAGLGRLIPYSQFARYIRYISFPQHGYRRCRIFLPTTNTFRSQSCESVSVEYSRLDTICSFC